MAKLFSPAYFTQLARWWLLKLVLAAPPVEPKGKHILSLFVGVIDRIIPIDNNTLNQAVPLAARHDKISSHDVITALKTVLTPPSPVISIAHTATEVLEALILRMANGAMARDRVTIDPAGRAVLDFLNEWFLLLATREQQPGGAPSIFAQVLSQMDEPNVALWLPYLSILQAGLFDDRVRFLKIEPTGAYSRIPIRSAGRLGDPEVINYAMEFGAGPECALQVGTSSMLLPGTLGPDRVIALAPPPPAINHIVAADLLTGRSSVKEVAETYSHWLLVGIHKVDTAQQATVEDDIRNIPKGVTLHVEIATKTVSAWQHHILHEYVNSASANMDDIEEIAQNLKKNAPEDDTCPGRPDSPDMHFNYLLDLAIWIASKLDMERFYVHGLKLDFVLRQKNASDQEMAAEVSADLLAKSVVMSRARNIPLSSPPPPSVGLGNNTLNDYINLCFLRVTHLGPAGGITTLSIPQSLRDVLYRGWFDDISDLNGRFRVAVVPVALFQSEPPGLRFVGAGDTTSAVSFIYSGFQTRGNLRT